MSKETDETMPKKEFQGVQLQTIQSNGGMRLALNTFAELEKFACMMATSNFVPKHLRGKPADCLAVLLQSMRWEMDPFAVAQKTYFVNDGMGYEAQLVNAIIISRAPIKQRPKFEWTGEGESLKCKVSATFKGEDEASEFEAEIRTISTRNSPLWKQQPKQQLSYFALRAWARIYAPDVIMGVYTKEEVEDMPTHIGADNAVNITPSKSTVSDLNAEFLNVQEVIEPTRTDPLNASIDKAMSEMESADNAATTEDDTTAPILTELLEVPADTIRTGAELQAATKLVIAHMEKTPQEWRQSLLDNFEPGLLKALADKGLGRSHGDKIRKLLGE